jgi:NaMN:DMB phosphoribosyltransferase
MQPVAIAGDETISLQAAGPKAHESGGSNMLGEDVQNRLDSLTKPKGCSGFRDEIGAKTAMMQGNVVPGLPEKKAVCVFAGYHGVAAFADASITTGPER